MFGHIALLVALTLFAASMYMSQKRSILLALFLSPWQGVQIPVGVSVSLSQIILLGILLKLITLVFTKRFGPMMTIKFLMLAVLFSGITGATIEYLSGSFSGALAFRVIVVAGVFLISLIGFYLRCSFSRLDLNLVPEVVIWSGVALACLGTIQAIIFHFTAVDILPIGLLVGSDTSNSALMLGVNGSIFRASSLAGEPKSLGIFSAISLITLFIFWHHGKFRYFATLVLSAGVILSGSTSGFFIALAGVLVLLLKYLHFRILSSYYPAAFALAAGLVFVFVSNFELTSYHLRFAPPESTSDLIFQRTIGRYEVEDMDYVIFKTMLLEPTSFIFGKGFGLSHVGTHDTVPAGFQYLQESLIAPKSGVVFLISNVGLIGSVFFLLALVILSRNYFSLFSAGDPFLRSMVFFSFFMFICFLLRSYVMEASLLVLALSFQFGRSLISETPPGKSKRLLSDE